MRLQRRKLSANHRKTERQTCHRVGGFQTVKTTSKINTPLDRNRPTTMDLFVDFTVFFT